MAVTAGLGGWPILIRSAGILFATTSLNFATMSANSVIDASMLRCCISVGGSEDDSIAAVRSNRRPIPDVMLLPARADAAS